MGFRAGRAHGRKPLRPCKPPSGRRFHIDLFAGLSDLKRIRGRPDLAAPFPPIRHADANDSPGPPTTITASLPRTWRPSRMATVANPENRFTARKLDRPATVQCSRFIWPYVGAFPLPPAGRLLACVPWLFSWTGVLRWPSAGNYMSSARSGINLGYHRLLTHRSFTLPALAGAQLRHARRLLSAGHAGPLGGRPPHAPPALRRAARPAQPAGQLLLGPHGLAVRREPGPQRLAPTSATPATCCATASTCGWNATACWVWIYLAQWLVFYLVGFADRLGVDRASWLEGVQFGPEPAGLGRVRADGLRLAHHLVGQLADPPVGLPQLRDRREQPQQLAGGPVSNGEGWHNNHHAQPRAAAHGHRWWELDVTWISIWAFKQVGLAARRGGDQQEDGAATIGERVLTPLGRHRPGFAEPYPG